MRGSGGWDGEMKILCRHMHNYKYCYKIDLLLIICYQVKTE